ncbi:MAG: NAD-dependent epimerase/dehydratase family protein [Thermodesulfobacteriota bacterium]
MTNKNKTVLITGVCGFIGRYVARHFSKAGWRCVGIDIAASENAPSSYLSSYHSMSLPYPGLGPFLKDQKPDVCIHCAGRASVGFSKIEPADDFYNGPVMTFELLNAIRTNAPECRFLFLSSAAIYGNPSWLPVSEVHPPAPISPYGFHKLQCEQICREFAEIYHMKTAGIRIFSAYGQGLRRQVLWDICQKALSGNVVRLQGTGRESRDFIHAADIARAMMVIAEAADMRGEAYNLAAGIETTIKELAYMIKSALNWDGEIQFEGTLPPGTPVNWRADITKLSSLGFDPEIDIKDGVHQFADWCRTEYI